MITIEAPMTEETTVEISSPASPNALTGDDRYVFEIAKMKRQLALKDAEIAVANSERSEAEWRYTLLQLYVKHGLQPGKDSIDANGTFIRKETK
jgi:hypothetical protein